VNATVTAAREAEPEMTLEEALDELEACEEVLRAAGRRPALVVQSERRQALNASPR